ncbi:ATP-binding domain-containing protein [Methylocystis sp. IM2]|uniref:ATP-binding domain-containing protein n=1 Tax=unclassified Methylocystis TaxID=2625913 RepID=UPI0040482BA8
MPYALTVHKSQGSEFDTVSIVATYRTASTHCRSVCRRLAYRGIASIVAAKAAGFRDSPTETALGTGWPATLI